MNEEIKVYTFSARAMVVFSILFTVLVMISFDTAVPLQQVLAQAEETSPSPGEQKIVKQGIGTSSPDPLPGHQSHQSVTVLRLRDDNAVYSGRVTFTTTQPVEVQILQRNMTTTNVIPTIPEQFGKLNILQLPGGNGQVTITNVVPKFTEGATGTTFAASVPFSGNAVALHNLDGKKFVAAYTVTADILGTATRADDIAKE
jgi:hypothetical protein